MPLNALKANLRSPFSHITASLLTDRLHLAITMLGATWGLHPLGVSVCSLCASGAMTLLCAEADTDIIRLLGRWHSDEMLHYLHVKAYPLLCNLIPAMLQHGNFHVIPKNCLIHA
jgi:hypothetical protein